MIDAFTEPSRAFTPGLAKCRDAAIKHGNDSRRHLTRPRRLPHRCRLRLDNPLGPEPFSKQRVLHSLAHLPATSHISFTKLTLFFGVTLANGMADGERS